MSEYYVTAANDECADDSENCLIKYNGEEWAYQEVNVYDRGQIVYLGKKGN
jgi:hypothetical protein